MSDDTLSHEDALAALAEVRKEAASYRTKLRDAEKALADSQAKVAQYEQDSAERETARRDELVSQATDLPLYVIAAKTDVAELFTEGGTLDTTKLKAVEQQIVSELPVQPRGKTYSGSGSGFRETRGSAEPTWGNLLNE